MTREFIEVPLFTRRWSEIGLTVDDLLSLQVMLLDNPQAGPVMENEKNTLRKFVKALRDAEAERRKKK